MVPKSIKISIKKKQLSEAVPGSDFLPSGIQNDDKNGAGGHRNQDRNGFLSKNTVIRSSYELLRYFHHFRDPGLHIRDRGDQKNIRKRSSISISILDRLFSDFGLLLLPFWEPKNDSGASLFPFFFRVPFWL
jgi:hypothetical protein